MEKVETRVGALGGGLEHQPRKLVHINLEAGQCLLVFQQRRDPPHKVVTSYFCLPLLTLKLLESQDSFLSQHLEDLAQCLTLQESIND